MSAELPLTEQDWRVRLFIYRFFVEQARPPNTQEAAAHFMLDEQAAAAAYQRLNDHHQIFLKPGTRDVLMANPLSAVPTLYQVRVNGQTLWANCAWDSLGIPAMLHADAEIIARDPLTDAISSYQVKNGSLHAPTCFVHFPLPASRWYDDLTYT